MTRMGFVSRWVRSISRRGLTQVEVLISSIIVGVLMVASLSTIAASRRGQMLESSEARGMTIAQDLMTEIAELSMREPSCDCGFGPESGESRASFDDVDDYHGLVDSPPKSRNGVALQGVSDLKRTVDVAMVKSTDWNSSASTYEGVYRITVRVFLGSSQVCTLVRHRTAGSIGSGSPSPFTSLP